MKFNLILSILLLKLNSFWKLEILENIFQQSRRNFIAHGYTVEKLEKIKERLISLFGDWTEYAISSAIEIARQHSIKQVAIHTSESIAQRDPSIKADKIKMYYDNIAKSFGFKKETLTIGGKQGNFWIRTASIKNTQISFPELISNAGGKDYLLKNF